MLEAVRSRVSHYLDHVGYLAASADARKCLLGVVLIKFGTGSIGIWGIVNVYYFSHFRQQNQDLKMSDVTLLITIAALPIGILGILSMKFARSIGYERMIRIGMTISPISVILGSFAKGFLPFAFLNQALPGACFGLTVIPVLSCLWTHFQKSTGSVTGIALAAFGMSAFFFSILATLLVNPNNDLATIEYKEGSQLYYLFEEDISRNVPRMTFWLGILQLCLCTPGSFLISHVDLAEMETIKALELSLLPRSDVLVSSATQEEQSASTTAAPMTLIQAVKSAPFILIYVSTFFLSCFALFVNLNLKTYGLTKINDDHFLTIMVTVCTLISSISNLVWGFVIDSYNFRQVYLTLIICILTAGFLFPFFATNKFGFVLTYQVLGICERGLQTIIGPGLVKIFGMQLGAELLPLKGTSFFLALISIPLVQLVLLKHFNFDEVIHLLLLGNVAAFFIARKLQPEYKF